MGEVHSGVLVGERYAPLGEINMDAMVAEIVRKKPQVVFNTLNGDSNSAFFKALEKSGDSAVKIPVMCFSAGEVEMSAIKAPKGAEYYAVWNYFQSIATPQNEKFVKDFHKRFGLQSVLDDPMEASYTGFNLWLQAAREAASPEPVAVQRTILRQTFNAPGGIVAIDSSTRHLWKTPNIGKARQGGQFDIVWSTDSLVKPVPYPSYRFQKEWERLLASVEGAKQ